MRRHSIPARPGWRATATRLGFHYADMYGAPYWDETALFSFTLDEIENAIEDPSRDLHQMCLALADRAASDERIMARLGVPSIHRDYVAASWRAREPSLYGRLDLAFDGFGPVKLLEYNADTPTGLYEAAVFQWIWLEEAKGLGIVPPEADQFNSVHEHLVTRFAALGGTSRLHLAGILDDIEDGGTLRYLADCAQQAGHKVDLIAMADIGVDRRGRYIDLDDRVISRMFKLYPWEWMFAEEYAAHLAISGCVFIEPPWKAMLSTKAILPLLWEMFPGHPNLLPAFFAEDPRAGGLGDHVVKPLFSREGENITLVRDGRAQTTPGSYGNGGFVVQEATRLFSSSHGYAVIGSWIVGDTACGIGIREDASPITANMSRFVPHIISR